MSSDDTPRYLTPDDLTAAALDEDDVPIRGGVVRVRALTRGEVMAVRKATDTADQMDGPRALVLERKLLAKALVEPRMSEAQVGRWQDTSPAGEIEPVVARVQELSGMQEGASKSSV